MSMPAPRRLSYSITNASELRSPSQTSPLNVRRIGGVTMAENCPSTRLSIAQEPHRNRLNEGSALGFSCHAHYTHVSQSLWRGLQEHAHQQPEQAPSSHTLEAFRIVGHDRGSTFISNTTSSETASR